MTENQLRQKVADTITAWVGATKGSKKHLDILDTYNNHAPLANGYKVKPTDAYCATTVSAAFIRAGIAEYTGTECGVERFVKLAMNLGIWVENDAHTPKIGDACVYDWEDTGAGDCTGWSDHIGIVTTVYDNSFIVTEGNMTGGKVGTRKMSINGRYIRGFICPDYAEIAKKMPGEYTKPQTAQETEIKYTVKSGDTLMGIAIQHGTTATELAKINGITNPNMLKIGQVIYLSPAAEAVDKLATLGVINSPEYWTQAAAAGKVKYLDQLLINAAKTIKRAGPRTPTVEAGVAALAATGVINTPEYWLTNYKKLANLGELLCALGGAVK